jgi:hypothetical protein
MRWVLAVFLDERFVAITSSLSVCQLVSIIDFCPHVRTQRSRQPADWFTRSYGENYSNKTLPGRLVSRQIEARGDQNVRNNSTLIFVLGSLLAFVGQVSWGQAASEQKASYGTRVKYQAGQKIEFPDFTVEYVGERRKTMPVYPRGFLYYDFKVGKGNSEKVISWTTGTGIIDPTDFEFDGKSYYLELRRSVKLGELQENEFVIWQGRFGSK